MGMGEPLGARVQPRIGRLRRWAFACLAGLCCTLLAACGGGGGADAQAPLTATTVSASGGTVSSASGVQVTVPAGALASATPIGIESNAAGAPALPASVVPAGPVVALTPHGTHFAVPVTVSLPFDAAKLPAGATPVLYKTNAAGGWELVPGTTVSGNTIVAQVSSFSWFQPAPAPDPLLVSVVDEYSYLVEPLNRPFVEISPVTETDGEVDDHYDPRPISLAPPGVELVSGGNVYVSGHGIIYWTSAIAPAVDFFNPNSPVGYQATLKHTQVFRKTDGAATLKLVISQMNSETIDGYGRGPNQQECRVLKQASGIDEACLTLLVADSSFKVTAFGNKVPQLPLAHGTLIASLWGWVDNWRHSAGTVSADSTLQFASPPDVAYEVDLNVDLHVGDHARIKLNAPIVIEIPLGVIGVNDEFTVQVEVESGAANLRGGDAFAGTWLHDPQKFEGVHFESQGVTPVAALNPKAMPPVPAPPQVPAAPCTRGIDPAAGTLQFSAAESRVLESRLGGALLFVTRTGGSRGEVSAMVNVRDGTARAGVDYRDASTLVRFADGEQGTRFLRVPLIPNDREEADRTVLLTLTGVQGCATLGATSVATLTIVDDDHPLPSADHALGGSVSGLAGSGLVLRNTSGDEVRPTANGAFTFPTRLVDGTAYAVTVATQPVNPAQQCSVTRASGTIAGADITDVAVDCVTPLSAGALDASFGSGGRVSGSQSAARALALQADGRLLVVGGLTLSRYLADGSPDPSFGSGGKVTVVANGGPADAMQAVAVQGDGRIVVAGYTALPTAFNDDMVVLRYNADGSVDTSFGVGGKAVIDFAGLSDRAHALLLQGDGKIIAAGFATLGTLANADQDIALVRLTSTGALDPAFGSGGKATLNVAGKADFGYAAALQPDGRIVVAGRVAATGGTNPDIGVARFLASGAPDTGFGSNGSTRIDFGGGVWDEAADVALQSDGAIVVGGFTQNAGVYRYALARLTTAGQPDTAFGTAGLVSTALTGGGDYGRALALQADGRILVAGQLAATGANPDMGVARYTASGVLDTGFGGGGLVRIDFFGGIDNANDVVVQPDGRIVLAGSARNGSATGIALARVAP